MEHATPSPYNILHVLHVLSQLSTTTMSTQHKIDTNIDRYSRCRSSYSLIILSTRVCDSSVLETASHHRSSLLKGPRVAHTPPRTPHYLLHLLESLHKVWHVVVQCK